MGMEMHHSEAHLRTWIGDDSVQVPTMHRNRLGGRPTKFRPEYCFLALRMLADTHNIATIRSVAATIGISPNTLYEWQRQYPVFAHAIFAGKAIQECFLTNVLAKGVKNYEGILAVLIHLHGWRRNGRRSEDGQGSLREALEAQAAGTRRVQWDRAIQTSPSVSSPTAATLPPH